MTDRLEVHNKKPLIFTIDNFYGFTRHSILDYFNTPIIYNGILVGASLQFIQSNILGLGVGENEGIFSWPGIITSLTDSILLFDK